MHFSAQSVDARNQVIFSASMSPGLAAALMNFGFLDMIVGLAVLIFHDMAYGKKS
jgi:hypothetical protein